MKISNLILKYLIFELIPQYVYLTKKMIQLKHALNLNYCLFTYKLDFMYLTKLRLSTAKKTKQKTHGGGDLCRVSAAVGGRHAGISRVLGLCRWGPGQTRGGSRCCQWARGRADSAPLLASKCIFLKFKLAIAKWLAKHLRK